MAVCAEEWMVPLQLGSLWNRWLLEVCFAEKSSEPFWTRVQRNLQQRSTRVHFEERTHKFTEWINDSKCMTTKESFEECPASCYTRQMPKGYFFTRKCISSKWNCASVKPAPERFVLGWKNIPSENTSRLDWCLKEKALKLCINFTACVNILSHSSVCTHSAEHLYSAFYW